MYRTDVLTWHRDGSATLETGGWNTMHSRERINSALGYGDDGPLSCWGVGPERGKLYLFHRYYRDLAEDAFTRYAWHDGLRIWPDGDTDAKPKPRRPYRPHPHPERCRCCIHAGSWHARHHGRALDAVGAVLGALDTAEADDVEVGPYTFTPPPGIEPLRASEYARRFNDLLMRGKEPTR